MSTTSSVAADQKQADASKGGVAKVFGGALLVLLIAFLALGLVTLQGEKKTEEQRRAVARAGGRTETERHVPAWLEMIAGPDFHSFLDRTELVQVRLMGEKFGDSDLALVVGLPDIRTLNVSNSNVTNEGLKEIAKIKSLRSLDLSRTKVTEIASLTALADLEELILTFTEVKEAALEPISQFAKMRNVSFSGLRVGNRAIEWVAKCQHLEALNIDYAILGENALQPLHERQTLKFVSVKDAKRDPADFAAAKKALPNCKFVE